MNCPVPRARHWFVPLVSAVIIAADVAGAQENDVRKVDLYTYEVWPTGNADQDAPNVQRALDRVAWGGVVKLHSKGLRTGKSAVFDFGSDAHVNMPAKRASVKGDTDRNGRPVVTIRGGYMPFRIDEPRASAEITKLRFEGSRRAAIYVRRSAAASISGNLILDVVPDSQVGYPEPIAANASGSGIELGALACTQTDTTNSKICLDAPLQLGRVELSDNTIDVGLYDGNRRLRDPNVQHQDGSPRDTALSGIVLVNCNVRARIAGNTIRNTNRRAIHPLDTFGYVEIVGNTIELAPFSSDVPGSSETAGNYGIFVYNGHRKKLDVDRGAVHTVMSNTVKVASDRIGAKAVGMGILAFNANDAIISENTILYQAGARNAITVAASPASVNSVRPRFTIVRSNRIIGTHALPSRDDIRVNMADSTTIDMNTYAYVDGPPNNVIVGTNTGTVDSSSPNTIVDAYCDTPKISFVNAACAKP